WAYHDAPSGTWHGPAAATILDTCARADLLLNLSGANPVRSWLGAIPTRVFVDTDPVFTQISHLTTPEAMANARKHTAYLSFAGNIGRPGCTVPDDGLPWKPTRQPVVLDQWPPSAVT